MIWVATAVFFVVNMPVQWVGFELYARTLKAVGKNNKLVKQLYVLMIYLIFSALIVAPLLIGLGCFSQWNVAFREDNFYMVFFLSCYVISIIPGFLYFRNKHIESLRELGYFNHR